MTMLRTPVAILATALIAVSARAQLPEKPIQDNSFLLEEAYNQEDAVIQHISSLVFNKRISTWVYSFTDEWPIGSQRHQLSLTVPVQAVSGLGTGLGDVALNYRLQLVGSGEDALAITPRFTVLFPTTSEKFGKSVFGWQGALASSWQPADRLVFHTNAGVTLRPGVEWMPGLSERALDYNFGQSVIGLVAQRFNLMLEAVVENEQTISTSGRLTRATGVTLSPGFRWSHDLESGMQIVPGVAVPIGFRANEGMRGVLLYLSFEHEFTPLRRDR